MKYWIVLLFTLWYGLSFSQKDSLFIRDIYTEALSNGECYDQLNHLCKKIGHRLAGSESAARAMEWGKNTMQGYGFDSVYIQPVSVPQWQRGPKEECFYKLNGTEVRPVAVALGGSVGSKDPITSKVIEVKSIQALKDFPDEAVRGKIVFFNKAMDPLLINTGAAYGGAWDIRGHGPSEASRKGAAACIIRSLTLADDAYAHTGSTSYDADITPIPAAALSSVDARALSKALQQNPELELSLHLQCSLKERIIQGNVIGELRGTEFPEKYIVVGGHLDSWDIGEGAHDDGTGVTQSIEVGRIFRALNYQPRHTLRVVLFMNEEFGNDGGETYADSAKVRSEEHIAAIESDGGGFTPQGFSLQGTDAHLAELKEWARYFEPYQLFHFKSGWSGVDIGPLRSDSTALYGLVVDSQRYFDFHHSNNDVFENVNKREHTLGAAAMASLVYLIDQKKD